MKNPQVLKDLIAKDKLAKAFALIFDNHQEEFSAKQQQTLRNLSGQFHSNERNRRNNIISHEEYDRIRSRIRLSLLEVIAPSAPSEGVVSGFNKSVILLVVLALVAVGGYGIYTLSGEEPAPVKPETNILIKQPQQTVATDVDTITDTAEVTELPPAAKVDTTPIPKGERKASAKKETTPPTIINDGPSTEQNTTTVAETNTDTPTTEPVENIPLQVEITSNKGTGKVSVSAAESLKLMVKANQASYVRVIYRLADGALILLTDDLQVAAAQANTFVLIDEFEVAEPFGEETLYVFASTAKFPPLKTRTENGYYIITEGLPTALEKSKSKGLRAKSKLAEATLEVTTHQ